MPLIFIHGVNTRDTDPEYKSEAAKRTKLMQRLVLGELAKTNSRFAGMHMVDAYWGAYGVAFSWGLASLPEVRLLEDLGAENEETLEADVLFTEAVEQLAGPSGSFTDLEELGASDSGLFRRAAATDLSRFIDLILTQLYLSQVHLAPDGNMSPEAEGRLQACLAMAGDEAALDDRVQAQVSMATSDDEVIDLLRAEIQTRFERLVEEETEAFGEDASPPEELEALGADWVEDIRDRVGELFEHAKGAHGRAATGLALAVVRSRFHRRLTRFLGDVFVYLNERGDARSPGLIVSSVLRVITEAPRARDDEPLIIITHSMGGNILYDIITHFDPTIRVDVWISVGGQVAQFEEMKLFKASDKAVSAPQKVTGLKSRVGYWLNVYDPVDVLSFAASPVFAEVTADEKFITGASALKTHGEYFSRPSLYRLFREHIARGCHGPSLR